MMTILKLYDIRHCNYYSHILGTKPFSWHAVLHEWSQETNEVTNLAYFLTFDAKCTRSFLNWSQVRHEVKKIENHCIKQTNRKGKE